ncbi:hypothetical protein CY0110_16687 [Crocosphaera chwakensis CCY0110]|uniref:Uncharacterized protein n=1 Tax=Crocosphaera chwakensis CCY0110 TaxID=391612 RepID=A3II19_9CHRO|nr:hypothetical protein CY0110_16687 [Crocosphaera chwakensis CCY0110]
MFITGTILVYEAFYSNSWNTRIRYFHSIIIHFNYH